MGDTCDAVTTTLDLDAGEVPHRCGLVVDHKRANHVCFYCGHGWTA